MKRFRNLLSIVLAVVVVCFAGHRSTDADSKRSSKWPTVRNKFIDENPRCFVCGSEATQVHHLKPFHLHPELELEPSNLRSLCDCCHLKIAHLNNYQNENPDLDEHAKILREAKAKADKERKERRRNDGTRSTKDGQRRTGRDYRRPGVVAVDGVRWSHRSPLG